MAANAVMLGRLRRYTGLPSPANDMTGTVTAAAQGNSVVTSDDRGARAAQPGKGAGTGIANQSPYGGRTIVTPPSQLLRRARTPGYQHGRLIARDRHVAAYRGTVTLSGEHDSKPGIPDPDADGPARPGYRMLNRTLSWQIGTDSTRFLDNDAPKATTDAGGKPFPLGTQGDPWTHVYGGTPGLAAYRPYGKRGGPAGGPEPRVIALPGGPYRAGTVLQAGSPQDGPQLVQGGLPWGLHTPTVAPLQVSNATIAARFHQVRPPRMNRPLNSRAAGQSFDQQVVHLDGSQAVRVPKSAPGRQPGANARWRH